MEYYILAVGIAISAFAFAQEAAPKQFEVASIKPDHSSDNRMGVALEPGGRFVATNVPARFLIQFAYQLKDNQLSGLPGWADSDRYDIAAKPESGAGTKTEEVRVMMQSLLADRFQMTFHKETREMPIYALVVAKSGLKMQAAKGNADFGDDPKPRPEPGPGRGRGQGLGAGGGEGIRMSRGELNGANVKVAMIADQLSRIVGRSVTDETGLAGSYDFVLKYTPEGTAQPGRGPEPSEAAPPSDSQSPSIFAAVQEQLGLKLEPKKGPVDLYIIDRLEKPSEN
jgi:uncharacterized protein (TIGR03435 family)